MLVAVPVSSVQLLSRDLTGSHVQSYTHGQRVVFSDAEARDVTCRVNGSHPAPRVAVYVDQVDISDQFTQTHTDRVTVGPSALPGLQVCTCVCVCTSSVAVPTRQPRPPGISTTDDRLIRGQFRQHLKTHRSPFDVCCISALYKLLLTD